MPTVSTSRIPHMGRSCVELGGRSHYPHRPVRALHSAPAARGCRCRSRRWARSWTRRSIPSTRALRRTPGACWISVRPRDFPPRAATTTAATSARTCGSSSTGTFPAPSGACAPRPSTRRSSRKIKLKKRSPACIVVGNKDERGGQGPMELETPRPARRLQARQRRNAYHAHLPIHHLRIHLCRPHGAPVRSADRGAHLFPHLQPPPWALSRRRSPPWRAASAR